MTPIKKCNVPTCKHHFIFALGLCETHYRQWVGANTFIEENKKSADHSA